MPDTIDAIIHNSVNAARVISDTNGGWFDIQRYSGATKDSRRATRATCCACGATGWRAR